LNLGLAPGLLDQIVAHTRYCLPLESCGLLVGRDSLASQFIPITNRLASATEFDMEPAELIAALRSLRTNGDSLLAIVHSHPRGPALPSAADVRKAWYPDAAQVIVSFASVENPVVRGFRILDGEVKEIELRAIV
jgi:[CysO sulfur-carrier protein]-S-L-cysteine hydrolase